MGLLRIDLETCFGLVHVYVERRGWEEGKKDQVWVILVMLVGLFIYIYIFANLYFFIFKNRVLKL